MIETYHDVLKMHEKENAKLRAIKTIVDAYYSGAMTVTTNQNDFNMNDRIYYIDTFVGMIQNQVYEGLNENIPERVTL